MSDCCNSTSSRHEGAPRPETLPEFPLRPGVAFPDWSVVTLPAARNALLAIKDVLQVMAGSNANRWNEQDHEEEDRVRSALIQFYFEKGKAPTLQELAQRVKLSEPSIHRLVERLRRRDLVVVENEKIVGAYPCTDWDTSHHVELDGRSVRALCAIDALGIGAMIKRDVAVASRCFHCGMPIRVTTRDCGRELAQVKPEAAVVWQSTRYRATCAANSLCTTTAFFCSDDHLAAWRRERSADETGIRLRMDEALQVGRALFEPILAGLDTVSCCNDDTAAIEAARSSSSALQTAVTAERHRRNEERHASTYDLVVIGAGSAGFSAAIAAADLGARVAVVGSGTIGGTCVNIGCIPSKTLIRAAEQLHNARIAARFAGVTAQAAVVDWQATVRQKNELVTGLRQTKYIDLLPAYSGIAFHDGAARLVEGGVEVDGTHIPAGKIIIATGARPAVPAILGLDAVPYLTSTTALDLETLPKSLLVIGGGYVGAELAQMFARAGVKVTLVCRSRLLPKTEPEISTALTRYFEDEAISVVAGIAYREIRKAGNGIALTVSRGERNMTLEADQVLIATGRTPNTEDLGLAERGIAVSRQGGVVVDEHMRTTRSGIYAAGDVIGRDEFVYMAAYGAKLAAVNALNGESQRYDNRAMPTIVFTDPQVASVGLTEMAAREAGHDIRVSTIGLDQVPRALAARDTRGLIKLVADARSGRLLGAHILAPEGADSIQTAALAIRHGLTVADLADTIFPYLTTVEGLKLAALSFAKDVAKLSCCAG
jgi:mercury(II) reductase